MVRWCINCAYWKECDVAGYPGRTCTNPRRGDKDRVTGEYICWEPAYKQEKEKA